MAVSSALYLGNVVHSRLRPRRHRLRYRAYWILLDIDAIDRIAGKLRFFSYGRFNLFSVHDRDYGEGRTLREHARACLAQSGIVFDEGQILLLAMPRILGYAFNPLSIFYCYGSDGALRAVIHEVHNTFGERHSYALPVETSSAGSIRQTCRKAFHVSPFMAMDMDYQFTLGEPAERVAVAITAGDADGPIITTALSGKRRPLSDAALLGLFWRVPLLTLKVIAGIHWEALRLWMKGLRVYPHPRQKAHARENETMLGTQTE